jgi:hypothetical protein
MNGSAHILSREHFAEVYASNSTHDKLVEVRKERKAYMREAHTPGSAHCCDNNKAED